MHEMETEKRSRDEEPHHEEVIMLLHDQKRLSLAYGDLDQIPFLILKYLSDQIEILDLSHNKFQNLSFLQYFPHLQTVVLDKNPNLDCQTLPMMKSLEVLWLNNCNLINIIEWLQTIRDQCPSIKYLSMMCNPVGSTVLNGVTDLEEKEYFTQVLKILPKLEYFDGIRVKDEHRRLARRRKLSLKLLQEIFRRKLIHFVEFSTSIHNNYLSIKNIDEALLKKKYFIAKNASS